jgi:hypothetical protein
MTPAEAPAKTLSALPGTFRLGVVHWRMIFCAAVAASTGGEAGACVYSVFDEEIGPKRTGREIAADEARLARERLVRNTRAAQRQLAEGADPAEGLADMLVPNIQPVHIEASSCGVGEIDWADTGEARYEPLAGTVYAGRETEFRRIVNDYGPGTLGPYCNAEFRTLFAGHLRRRLAPARLKQSYIFLAVRRPHGAIQRLMAFEGKTRRPPVHWVGDAQIAAWTRRHPAGRALSAAIADFWREMAPRLAGVETSCPAAYGKWRQDQASLVARIEESLLPGRPKP